VVLLAAPTSTDERVESIARSSQGFIYLVSLSGITGARKTLSSDIAANVVRIRKHSDKPVAVGFGISSPSQVKEMLKFADGVIIGSAIVKIIENNLGQKALVKKVGSFVKSLRRAA